MLIRVLAMMLALFGSAQGQEATDPATRAARRFPQPVRVDALLGRRLLQPIEAQPVLGHVIALTRRPGGGTDFLIETGGVLGIGTHTVSVPAEAIGLLGEHVALLDMTPEQLAALPPALSEAALPGDTIVHVGLAKPFH